VTLRFDTILLASALAVVTVPARANDSMAETAIGGLTLTKSADVVMESEDLFVSEEKITVDYVFTNTSAKDIETLVAFPLPDVVNGPEDVHRPDFATELEFQTTIDGKPAELKLVQVAMVGGTDVTAQVRAAGLIDLPTMQKYLNLWYTLSLDLFGGEISSNAATYFATGMKGRAKEDQFEDHKALEGSYAMEVVKDGKIVREDIAMRNAMNEVLRDAYVEDCQRGVDKWNRTIAAHGIPFELKLPSRRFHRHIGIYAGIHFDPAGNPLTAEQWESKKNEWLPSDADKQYVQSLMQKPVFDPKQMANWIAAPKQGIKGRTVDFEYVRREA